MIHNWLHRNAHHFVYKAGTEGKAFYLVSSRRKVMRSFLSLGFFRPPKAILVPGMYFLGFSRYSNCDALDFYSLLLSFVPYQSAFLPRNSLILVGVGVRETLDLTRFAAEETV
jgi:hypothetical protein